MLPAGGMAPSKPALVAVTAAPDWVSDAFQIWVIACVPGQVYPICHPVVAVVPVLVTVKPSWKPPCHELVRLQLTAQPEPADGVVVVVVGGAVVVVGGTVVVGDAVVVVGGAVVDVVVGGGAPVPVVRTTTDSAGSALVT